MIQQKILTALAISIFSLSVTAQENTIVLSMTDYLDVVRQYHPMMRQAQILADMADPIKREARGAFDPVIDAVHDQKQFKDTNYYTESYAALKVPTWYGIELKADYERTNGDFLNPSESLPERGLWSAGLSIGLGRGLILDDRRAALKQADIYAEASLQEQIIMENDLVYDAILAYINWQQAYGTVQIAQEGVELATQRLNVTRESWRNGDKPAIDTLEATISLQTRQQGMIEAQQFYNNATIELENYLWQQDYVPLELVENSRPQLMQDGLFSGPFNAILVQQDQIVQSHPEILTYLYKIESLDVDRRLTKEDLKPDLRVSYNPLIGTNNQTLFATPRLNDYKLGASLYYPILQRKARGKLQQIQLKIEDSNLGLENKRLSITNKLNTYVNNTELRAQKLAILDLSVRDYSRLLDAENRKFAIGESSIFLINSREAKYLESRLKRLDTIGKLIKDRATYVYLAGEMRRLL